MIRNYLKIAYRNLVKHKRATFIKLLGLSIGMCCCMLILLYIADELSYNKFNAHYKDIYRLDWNNTLLDQHRKMAAVPIAAGPVIAQDLSQLGAVARMYNRSGNMEVKTADSTRSNLKFQELNVYFADNDLFKIFSIHFVDGNTQHALSQPNSIVINTEMAKKYFGTEPAVGKTLLYDNKILLQVSAVVEKLPTTSDVQFDFLIPFDALYSVETKPIGDFLRNDWIFNPASTFILMNANQRPAAIEASLNQLVKKYGDERARKYFTFSLQPLPKIHLYASDVESNPSTNSIAYIYIFAAIAFLILVIANINFINLSNAQSLTRLSEIGVRKVSGAGRMQLIAQFLGEGLLLSFGAFLVAIVLTGFTLPLLNQVTDKQLAWPALLRPGLISIFFVLFILTGFLAGLYPAFFITRFKLTSILKGNLGNISKGGLIRKSLITSQFCIAIILIIGAAVIYRQLQFLHNKPLGFKKDQMLVVPLFGTGASEITSGVDGPLRARMNAFENDLRQYNAVYAITLGSTMPGNGYVNGLIIPEGHTEQDNIFAPWASVDYDFLQTFKIPIIAGRDFSKKTGTDHLQAFIINESAVRLCGWKSPEEAIGKTLTRGNSQNGKKGQIIGVIKDFNFNSLDRPMEPLVVDINVPRFTEFGINIKSDHIPTTIQYIRKKWDAYFPERVFEYSFLDENINNLYKAQENLGRIIGYFACIAIFISCIGLFSLASFMAVQRKKEIGIRKVLGASISSIVVLLFEDFLALVVIALLIASPVALLVMHKWLTDFAYRVSISWWIFLAAGAFAVLITLITVSIEAVKAAMANPVKNLRTE